MSFKFLTKWFSPLLESCRGSIFSHFDTLHHFSAVLELFYKKRQIPGISFTSIFTMRLNVKRKHPKRNKYFLHNRVRNERRKNVLVMKRKHINGVESIKYLIAQNIDKHARNHIDMMTNPTWMNWMHTLFRFGQFVFFYSFLHMFCWVMGRKHSWVL